ncbi:hypothetical protein EAF00_007559 [Botryotinia globosa]|nr:hypothetical protein EAF00_007559 [Botryotinia globosa]
MTRQPSDQYIDAPGQSTNPLPVPTTQSVPRSVPQSVPQSAPPPQNSADQQISSSGHVYPSINAASCSRGQGQEDVFVPPPRLTYLDLLIMENSGFPSMAEFEIFLQLYQKSYYHMELAERKKLFQQVELLRRGMRHPQSVQALVEAQQSIQAGQPFLSLKHYANFSRNGYMLTSMISRCLNLTSFALQRAVFKAALEASRNTHTPNIATISGKSCEDILTRGVKHWTAEDILKLETIVYIRPSEHHVNNPPSKVTSRTDFSYFSHDPPLHCPDPPKYGDMKIEPNDSTLSLQQPWTYSQCLDYLAGRTINFMNSRDPEAFFFSLPSDDKLQGMTADQRAEFVRKHILEEDAKRTLSKSGNDWYPVHAKTSERSTERAYDSLLPELDTTASISKVSPYIQESLVNHRNLRTHDIYSSGGRHGFESPSNPGAEYERRMAYGRKPPSSIVADDGYCNSDLGDDDDSDWVPTQSDNWSSQSRLKKRVSFAALVTDIPGNLRGQQNSIVPSDSLSCAEWESENDEPTTADNGPLSENIPDRQDCLWATSAAHATSAIEVVLASGAENDNNVSVIPPHTSSSKRGNRKRSMTRGRRVVQPRRRAQRRGGYFDTLINTLENQHSQLSSLPKLSELLSFGDEKHQTATEKPQGIQAQEALFTTSDGAPVQRGVSNVGCAPQEYCMLGAKEMYLEQQRKRRTQLLQEQAAMQAETVLKPSSKNDHDLEASGYKPELLTTEQESKNQVELKRQEQDTKLDTHPFWEKGGQTKTVESSRVSLGNDISIRNSPSKFYSLASKEARQFKVGQHEKLKQDMATKFDDLKKFADEFKMSTAVPSDIAFINHGEIPVAVWQNHSQDRANACDEGPLRIAIKEDNLRRSKGAPFDESNVEVISVEEATRLLAAQKLAKEISTATKSTTGTSPPIPASHQLNGFDHCVTAAGYDQDRFIQAAYSSANSYKANHDIHSFGQDNSMNAKYKRCSERSRLRLRFNDLSGELF